MFRWFNSLKVAKKIFIGYGTAIAVAVMGISIGYILADLSKQKANLYLEDASEELLLLNNLEKNLGSSVVTMQNKRR